MAESCFTHPLPPDLISSGRGRATPITWLCAVKHGITWRCDHQTAEAQSIGRQPRRGADVSCRECRARFFCTTVSSPTRRPLSSVLVGLAAGAAPMRSPPSPDDSGDSDSHASRSPPLKRKDGGKKVDDETNTVLSYRNCNFSQCAAAAPPACTHLLSRSHNAPRASQTPAERGNHQSARQLSRLARAVGERSAVTPRPGSRT